MLLQLDVLGPVVNVDSEKPPYRHTHCLTTNHPGTELDSGTAHSAVIAPRNAAVFSTGWKYLRTENTEQISEEG